MPDLFSRRPATIISGAVRSLLLLSLVSQAAPASVLGQDFLTESSPFSRMYVLSLTGTTMHEKFSAVEALLTFKSSPPESGNPFLIIVEGFPSKDVPNSFFWFSEDCNMTALGNQIACKIKRIQRKSPVTYFSHLSPVLLGKKFFSTAREEEIMNENAKLAQATSVIAQSGELRLNVYANGVSGNVWIKGYDPVERSHVLYSAEFSGKQTLRSQRWQRYKK